VHHAAATLRAQSWSLSLYAENLFNKYAYTGVRSTPVSNQTVTDDDGNPVRVRSYYHDLLRPRQVGLRFTYDFSL
jgi:outer membrane receptor protein involved in Fe transport